jgi:flavorubredoxin
MNSTYRTSIDEIVDGVYRIATVAAGSQVTFNQFLIDDEQPALIHTGEHGHYERIRAAIAQVLDPARLAHVALLHFEGDECGGMDRFMAEAPRAQLVASALSARLNLARFPWRHRVHEVCEGQTLELGRRSLRVLETPHVHHWDSMMLFEETTKSLFPSDLFLQPGEQPAVVTENLGAEMCTYYQRAGIFAGEQPVRSLLDRIEPLDPAWTHAMHGGSIPREAWPPYVRALRERPFAYQGRLFGRPIEPAPQDGPAGERSGPPTPPAG